MRSVGGETHAEAKANCEIAAYGPWLADSVKCFHERVDCKMSQQLHAKVHSAMLGQTTFADLTEACSVHSLTPESLTEIPHGLFCRRGCSLDS